MRESKPCFTLKMLDCCLNLLLPCERVLPRWWVVFRVVTGRLIQTKIVGSVQLFSLLFCWHQTLPSWVCLGCFTKQSPNPQ